MQHQNIPSEERLFPEMIWDNHPEPKTTRTWVFRFNTLQYCLADALSPRFDAPEIAESTHRALGRLVSEMPVEAREVTRIQDYIAERGLEV